MTNSFKTKTAVIATIGVLGFGGVAVAATTSTAPTPLTGSITDQASSAALADYPGATLVGIRSQADGSYEAQVRKADGTTVHVELDKDFKVIGTHAGGPGDRRGRGGPGGFGPGVDTAALAKTLGVTEEKLRTALGATRGAKKGDQGDRAAEIAQALGATAADVQSVLDGQSGGDRRGPGRGGPGPHGDDAALVTALAEKTGKSKDAVTKALEGLHAAREDARAAELAKELGVDAAKVKAALEAARPERP
ncbi:MAG: PepSY domain-containing protein [Patulibacter sp.]|nr:PepSY domain-containing protein [Patulibacter sp.]